MAYVLYAPLYLTGPIVTFNDYISQQRYKPQTVTRHRTAMYGIRFLVVLLTMELLIHYVYAVAIAKADPDWSVYTPFQLSMLGYFHLHHIWLKLLIPWRFFRLWALLDDIDPPEDMARCMSNNYSALAFWRGWHRSYNRWIVRYVYIPLGGSGKHGVWGTVRTIANFALVFMFVAVWHDINLRLLMWGWLITLFVLPEIVATFMFPASKWADRPNTYRVICGVGAIGNILMMMIANLVGYAIGIDGLKGLVHGIIGSAAGVALFAAACGCLYIGVQIMFEVREEEKRAGIKMPC
jgi:protein-cysteine N-palmitoyltransferase HHAT